MRIPKSFYLKGHKWVVEYKWGLRGDDNAKLDGQCVRKDRIIQIERSLPREEKWPVFLHEFMHASLFELHVTDLDGGVDGFLEEVICEGLSRIMSDSFRIRWKRKRSD